MKSSSGKLNSSESLSIASSRSGNKGLSQRKSRASGLPVQQNPVTGALQLKKMSSQTSTQLMAAPKDEEMALTQPMGKDEEMDPAQCMPLAGSKGPKSSLLQRKVNNTGLPDSLKAGVEHLSGTDISDVKVSYNSSKPAQLNAHAIAQGNEIHVAQGMEKHLPHEAWHVAQQKQGRVKPTREISGTPVNDSKSLEGEADAMGSKAASLGKSLAG